ncbi:MAG: hypothetical protein ACE149_03810 [Armatimonadota bacterium]
MTVADQWHRVLGLVRLPDEPRVLLASPDNEAEVLTAVSRLWPRARLTTVSVGERLPADSSALDLALFDHALDDIVLEAVARAEGISDGDRRGEHAPRVRAIRAYWRSGELERVARPALAKLVAACERALRPGALIIFSHRVAGADLPGQPMDFYTDCLALARRWLSSAGLPLEEIQLDTLDPHWWLSLRKVSSAS